MCPKINVKENFKKPYSVNDITIQQKKNSVGEKKQKSLLLF